MARRSIPVPSRVVLGVLGDAGTGQDGPWWDVELVVPSRTETRYRAGRSLEGCGTPGAAQGGSCRCFLLVRLPLSPVSAVSPVSPEGLAVSPRVPVLTARSVPGTAMEVQSYYTKLLGELNEQRKRDFFCDCSIIVEGRIFKAHKNILFANSGYFRALLIHYIQDSGRHSTASLDIVTSEAFSIILDFLYSGKLDLCGENVIEVMSAASYLQMTDVVNFCKTYIRSSLDICRKIEREAAFYQADSGSSAREGTSLGSKSSASVSSLQEKERIPECQRDPPCGDCSSCHPLELVVRDPLSSDSPDDSSLPKGVEPKVEFDPDEVEVEVGERLPQYPAPISLEQMEEGQPVDLACNNYHMKQFLEALLRNSSAQRKEDVVHHFVRGFEGRAEDSGVAVSSMMDIHSDWYGEDTGERTRGVQAVESRREQLCWAASFVTLVQEYIAEYFGTVK